MSAHSKVAIVANTGLGDALWMMVVAHAFHQTGHSVTLYSNFLSHLKELFPKMNIQPYVKDRKELEETFNRILFQHHSPGSKEHPLPAQARVLYKEKLDLSHSYVWNLQQVAFEETGYGSLDIGLSAPKEWEHRKNKKRVVLHPCSADPTKNWRASQFIKLAQRLKKQGYDPQFIIPPDEKEAWAKRLHEANLSSPVSENWMNVAKYLYESGYFIGNDASPGHLASLLQIPTLSLFSRKSRATLYRPNFGKGEIVLPYAVLPGRTLRHRLWPYFLPVSRAFKGFQTIVLS